MIIKCPECEALLKEVEWGRTDKGQLIPGRAGDWYCDKCKSDKAISGYKYFWNHELGLEKRK